MLSIENNASRKSLEECTQHFLTIQMDGQRQMHYTLDGEELANARIAREILTGFSIMDLFFTGENVLRISLKKKESST